MITSYNNISVIMLCKSTLGNMQTDILKTVKMHFCPVYTEISIVCKTKKGFHSNLEEYKPVISRRKAQKQQLI